MAPDLVPAMPVLGWWDRWVGWRDGLLASERFRQWAVGFPLTRPIARRRTRALFDLCAGFVYSQILASCVQLGLFDLLAEGPATVPVLARRLGLAEESARLLLAAAASLRLVARRRSGRFGLGPLGAAMVDNPGIAAMIRHHALLYADLADPLPLLRGETAETNLSRYWAYATEKRPTALPADRVAAYSELMALSQSMVASEILDAYPVRRHRCLMDVGGGEGVFLAAAARRAAALRLVLVDLPAVTERARARLGAQGLTSRVAIFGADFFSDPLPEGADLVSLIRVLHDHDDAAALDLLRAIRRSLPAGGTLILAEPMSETPGAEPIGDAYFGFYLLAMRSGRPRSAARIAELLSAAGFGRQHLIRNKSPLLVRIFVAQA
jgi:demethylspheroidene O-methyltransferase